MSRPRPRTLLAPNASPMTLDGTTTHIVGRRLAAVIDPGSDDERHIDAILAELKDAERTVIIVTHYHPDHSAGAAELATRTGGALLGGRSGRQPKRAGDETGGGTTEPGGQAARAAGGGLLADGVSIRTDEGDLVVLRTPGHSPDHIALHWSEGNAIFCGDLMMGGLDTAVVAAPEGDLQDYMDSLERLRDLHPAVIYPAHGPVFTDPAAAIDRYLAHRRQRLEQVRAALEAGAEGVSSITDVVYGADLDPGLREFAEAAVEAYLEHLQRR
jgi:glyoxylase-like metal-dependent hydrolase (beta-lactamase superfamily II)